MRIAIINCFETYEIREKMIYDFFINRGDDVILFKSDFLHIHKDYIKSKKKEFIYIHTKSYKKNLSFTRLYSHYQFSKKVLEIIMKDNFDLIYALVPPNSLVKNLYKYKYKYKNSNVKLIFDIIDLWPETMPIGSMKNYFPFILWKEIRNKYIQYADQIITECTLYNDTFGKIVDNEKIRTIYFFRELNDLDKTKVLNKGYISLCYLGSINNIIDIDKIGNIINKISKVKPVVLKIIGDGEKKEQLISTAKNNGAEIIDYGKIYDPQQKQKIFNECDYGLNIYKDNTMIGVTMKSIDYLDGGLPLINSIKGDTKEFINKFHCGFNYDDFDNVYLEETNILKFKLNTEKVMKKYFDVNTANIILNEILKDIF